MANCAITSPTAGNSAKWPEITNHFLPLSLSAGVQGHFVSLAYWNRFSPEAQQKLTAAFQKMEDDMWDLAIKANEDASNCNIGKEPCVEGTKFNMTLVTVSPDDIAKIRDAVSTVILPGLARCLQPRRSELHENLERNGRESDRLHHPVSRLQDRKSPCTYAPAAKHNPVANAFEPPARFVAIAGGYWLMLIAAATCVEIISRKLFSFSLLGVDEVGGYTLAILAALGFSYALVDRAHTRIDVLMRETARGAQGGGERACHVHAGGDGALRRLARVRCAQGECRVPKPRADPAADSALDSTKLLACRTCFLCTGCDGARLSCRRVDGT